MMKFPRSKMMSRKWNDGREVKNGNWRDTFAAGALALTPIRTPATLSYRRLPDHQCACVDDEIPGSS